MQDKGALRESWPVREAAARQNVAIDSSEEWETLLLGGRSHHDPVPTAYLSHSRERGVNEGASHSYGFS